MLRTVHPAGGQCGCIRSLNLTEQKEYTMSEVKTVAEQVADLRARAAALVARADELEAREANAARLAGVAVGDQVSFKQGRAETRREVTGQVLFRGEVDGVDVVRALVGEGANVAIVQVKVADLLSASAPSEAAPEPQAEAVDVDALVEGAVQIG